MAIDEEQDGHVIVADHLERIILDLSKHQPEEWRDAALTELIASESDTPVNTVPRPPLILPAESRFGMVAGRRRHSVPHPVHPPHRQQRAQGLWSESTAKPHVSRAQRRHGPLSAEEAAPNAAAELLGVQ